MSFDASSAATSGQTRQGVDIEALSSFLMSINSEAPDLIFGPGPGESLYHYTDLGGLHGILSNDDLWLTSARYSNDDEEMTHGYRIANEVIAERREETVGPDWVTYLDCVAEILKTPAATGVFICCFCQTDNLLSQWRGYAASGTGVSLRFDPGEFANVMGPDSPHGGLMRLWKVFYEPDRQRRILRSALDFAFYSNPNAYASPQSPLADRARRAADAIEFFIPTFKNQDFSEEQEWRLIFTPPVICPVKPRFRVARSMLVPYFSLRELTRGVPEPPGQPSNTLPITGARVGPSVQKRLNMESVQMLVAQTGYTDIVVESSNTPFRG
jgi:hypothetical protein